LGFYDANISGSSQKSAPLVERSLSDVSSETGQESRKVITNSSFSLHVKNVDSAIENIRQKNC